MLSEKHTQAPTMGQRALNAVNKALKLRAAISLLTTEAPNIEITILGKIDLPPVRVKKPKIPQTTKEELPRPQAQTIGERTLNALNKALKLRAAISLLTTEAPKIEITILGKIDLPPVRVKKTRVQETTKEKCRAQLRIPDLRQLSQGSRHILKPFIKQQGKCYYCQSPMKLHSRGVRATKWEDATVEHLYPRGDLRRYLLNDHQCTVIACHHCNAEKNDQALHNRNHYDEILKMPLLGNMIAQYATRKAV